MKIEHFKKIAKVTGSMLAVSLLGLKTAAVLKRDHEYDSENEEAKNKAEKALAENASIRDRAPVIGEANLYEKFVKRGIDVTLSFFGLVILSPAFLFVAIASIVSDPGPVLFTQKRIGIDKTYFTLHKFRTMKMSTPHDTPTHLLENPEQYITGIGKLLRKYSLDELPQIWDIFIGKMSIVGPRPALWNQDDLIAERDKYGANSVKPGLTGWAQINGRDELEIDVKAKLDGDYVKALRSNSLKALMMDVKCFIGTIFTVAKADGVVEGGTGEINRQEDSETEFPKKKLLAITNHSYMFWQFRRELMAELQQDYEVVISTPFVGHEDDFAAMGCRMIETDVDRRGINPKTDLKLFRTYYRLLKKEKPDMVITYSIKPNVYAGLACRLLRIPYYTNVQGLGTAFQKEPIASLVTIMYKVACRKAKTVFFENQGNAQVFIDRHIISEKKITVLPGAGVNLDYYSYATYPQHEEVRFLYLGRIMKEKGMDELFYAIRKLHEKYGNRVQLDLVGFFEDEYKETVDQLVEDGIAVFHGFQEDPRPFYANADCVVLPSYHEGMSNVLLEAAAIGRCIVTSDIPGCKEAVDDDKSGFLCRTKDNEDLYKALLKVADMTKTEMLEMGRCGRSKVEREFSKDKVVRLTVDEICRS